MQHLVGLGIIRPSIFPRVELHPRINPTLLKRKRAIQLVIPIHVATKYGIGVFFQEGWIDRTIKREAKMLRSGGGNGFFPFLPNPNRKTLAKLLLLTLFCIISYLLGVYLNSRQYVVPPNTASNAVASTIDTSDCIHHPNLTILHTSDSSTPPLDFDAHHLPPDASDVKLAPVPFCPANFTHHCPCQDPRRERRFRIGKMFHRERHCPVGAEKGSLCRIPRPEGYKTPFPWPESRDWAWFANVPSTKLSEAKKDQHWVTVEGDRLHFPGGGTSFTGGVKGYVKEMAALVPLKTGEIRTALDIGCGVASFGGQLLDYNILTLSVAPRDVHEAQVQFALERGLPAILGVLSISRLPHPSRSFDMAHCARCLVRWTNHGGLHLMEIDRILRPGGYWVLSGPPINWKQFYKGWERKPEDLQAEQNTIEYLAKRLCWEKIEEKGSIAVWRKPINHVDCAKNSKTLNSPPFCEAADIDSAWYTKMDTCIVPLPNVESPDDVAGGSLEKWPERLMTIPPRILSSSIEGITAETFSNDNRIWKRRLQHYEKYIHSLPTGKYRNVMDMNAGMGSFAAALIKYPVWVMNVLPYDVKNNTLGIIFERGLIGTYMDWCEAFSTYPRTYDLIHANKIFSMYSDKCNIIDILLEMDRILRPQGAVIVRDHVDTIVKVKLAADRLNWQCQIVHTERGPFHPEKLLIVNSIDVNIK